MKEFDINTIDEVIHGRLRLGVMAYLTGAGAAEFATLKNHLQTTDGNLSTHLRKLEEAGYVEIAKSFRNRKPLTEIMLTQTGRDAFVRYLASLAKLIP